MLWGFHAQSDREFEIVIADDGSGEETQAVVERFQQESDISVQHVWHPDEGFQKCRILNKAVVAARGEYLVVTDGDCVPRRDFVSVHRHHAEPGCFLSGGYFKLPMATSEAISREDIEAGRCFTKAWLRDSGVPAGTNFMKLTATPWTSKWLNRLTPTKATWNGHNASAWKSDALTVNGFDERLQYGGLDREFGERLVNLGIKPKQIRYSAITVHLDHPRSYASKEGWAANHAIRQKVRNQRVIETPQGIRQL